LRRHAAAIEEQAQIFLTVDDQAHRLPQLARPIAAGFSDLRVVHVEADVEDRRLDLLIEAHAPLPHFRRQPIVLDVGVEAFLYYASVVVIALQEFVEPWNAFALAREVDAIEERQAAACVSGIDALGLNVFTVDIGRKRRARRRAACIRSAVPRSIALHYETM